MTVVGGRGDAVAPLALRHGPRAAQYLEGQLTGLTPGPGHQVHTTHWQSHVHVQVLVQLVHW